VYLRSVLSASAVALLVMASPELRAAPSAPSSSAASEVAADDPTAERDAQSWFRQGVAAYKSADLREAERCFRRAFELEQSYEIAGNFGQTLFDLGKMAEAANVLRYAVSVFPPTVSPEAKARAEQIFAEAASQSVELTIRCNVAGASVRVAGRPMGNCPLSLPTNVEPGRVLLEASHPGYENAQVEVAGEAGDRRAIELELVASVGPAASAAIASPPRDGEPQSLGAAPGVAVGAVALGTAVVGVVLLSVASSRATEADQVLADLREQSGSQYPCAGSSVPDTCADIVAGREAHDDLTNASVPVLVGAGALAIASGVLLALAATDEPVPEAAARSASPTHGRSRARWLVAPWLGTSAAGFGLRAQY
jgi:hypothetical protein